MTFISPEDIPQNIRAALAAQADRHQMMHETEAAIFRGLYNEATEDQLIAVNIMLSHCDGEMSWYYRGQITHALDQRFGICQGCGRKHSADDLLEEPAPPDAEHIDPDVPETPPAPEPNTEVIPDVLDDLDELGPEHPFWEHALDQYKMEYVPVEGNPNVSYLRCAGCKTPSPSMADRMVNAPGVKGCSACQQNAKWG